MESGSKVRTLLSQVLANAREMKRIRIRSMLQAEILTQLVDGRRTVGELTEEIYGVRRTDEGYHTYYMKVRRATRELQRRGYVSTNLFGREKPYKLTTFAVAQMMDVDHQTTRVIPLRDLAAYVLTISLGAANLVSASLYPFLSRVSTIMVYTAFVFMTGYSLCRLAQIFRRVR